MFEKYLIIIFRVYCTMRCTRGKCIIARNVSPIEREKNILLIKKECISSDEDYVIYGTARIKF